MDQESNPYDESNPYKSDDLTGGSSAGGGAGVPMSTKPRQEPSGAKPADPVNLINQVNQMAPAAPMGTPGTVPGAAPAAGTAPASPGAVARRSDEMVRYVLKHNPHLTVATAKQVVADADYTAPFFRSAPNVGRDLGETLQSGVQRATDHFQQKHDQMQQQMTPGQHLQGLKSRFEKKTRNLHPSNPKYQSHLSTFLNDAQQHRDALTNAFVKHQGESFRLHRSLSQSGVIPKKLPTGKKNPLANADTFYRNVFVHHSPHPWQHEFLDGSLPHINDVRAQQAQRVMNGTP